MAKMNVAPPSPVKQPIKIPSFPILFISLKALER